MTCRRTVDIARRATTAGPGKGRVRIFNALSAKSPEVLHLVDSSIVRAHQHSACGRGGGGGEHRHRPLPGPDGPQDSCQRQRPAGQVRGGAWQVSDKTGVAALLFGVPPARDTVPTGAVTSGPFSIRSASMARDCTFPPRATGGSGARSIRRCTGSAIRSSVCSTGSSASARSLRAAASSPETFSRPLPRPAPGSGCDIMNAQPNERRVDAGAPPERNEQAHDARQTEAHQLE